MSVVGHWTTQYHIGVQSVTIHHNVVHNHTGVGYHNPPGGGGLGAGCNSALVGYHNPPEGGGLGAGCNSALVGYHNPPGGGGLGAG
jgi:hypothetical protein